jgi:16S rRNA U516 pseudouridylate synthase RsuA-like enzyme
MLVHFELTNPADARRLIDTGLVTLINSENITKPKLDPSNISVARLPLMELLKENYAFFKPSGISVTDTPNIFDVLPSVCPSFFSAVTALERGSDGLLLLLNNKPTFDKLRKARLSREYSVELDPQKPLTPEKLLALMRKCPHVVPVYFVDSSGSAHKFNVKMLDPQPNAVRILFGSVGANIVHCRLESIGPLSLKRFQLESPGQYRKIDINEIRDILWRELFFVCLSNKPKYYVVY